VTSPRKKLERVRDALEVPDCDCPPMWYGAYYTANGEIKLLQLCRSRKTARMAFREHLRSEVWVKGFKPRGELIEVYPICEHVQQAEHPKPFEEWLAFLRVNFADEYLSPECLPRPTKTCIGTAARVQVYSERQRDGLELFCDEDDSDMPEHLQREVRRRRNGSLQILGLTIAGKIV
jgi:hypothetical protein